MAFQSLILPILIGLVAAVLLLTILYQPQIVNKFSDLGALIQLQTSRPYYYGIGWVPDDYSKPVPASPSQIAMAPDYSASIPNGAVPMYNYYPQTPLNPPKNVNKNVSVNSKAKNNNNRKDLAFVNPNPTYNSHKAYYWALSGGYPYPYPVMFLPPTDMDKVSGVEDKI